MGVLNSDFCTSKTGYKFALADINYVNNTALAIALYNAEPLFFASFFVLSSKSSTQMPLVQRLLGDCYSFVLASSSHNSFVRSSRC